MPTSTDPKAYYPPQKLNGKNEVSFFRAGMIDGRAHVALAIKKRVRYWRNSPQPRLLIHYIGGYDFSDPPGRAPSRAGIPRQIIRCEDKVVSNISGTSHIRVRVLEIDDNLQDFFLPSTCTDVVFLRRSLVILHRNSASLVSVLECVFSSMISSGIH